MYVEKQIVSSLGIRKDGKKKGGNGKACLEKRRLKK